MGPVALFDKSFLQALSVDESVWFDHFFYPIICPLFYVETLADLEKAVRAGRTPEQEVGFIARKTPEMHGGPSIHHQTLAIANLMGQHIPLNGRIPVAGGRPVKVDDKAGVIYDSLPESQAFSRWQKGEFLELERQFAQTWRASLDSLDLNAIAERMKTLGVNPQTCKSLEDAKHLADALVQSKDKPFDRMKLAVLFLDIPRQYEYALLERWSMAGYPPLSVYAPYAAHVLNVEVFFQVALAAGHISVERPSNRVDIGYLFYLPFCMVFISSDKLHRRCAPLYLRSDQDFVWGEDLKVDLKALNAHYSRLPDAEKEKGMMRFAADPPETGHFLVSQLWDRHWPSWRGKVHPEISDPEKDKELVDHLKRFTDAPTAHAEQVNFTPDDVDVLSIQRMVRQRKGSWWQLPKDLKEVDDD